ncbi:small integral membrane protein 30, partial [Eucyclogobius newberryi]|uniref:small integral membrane protein 30 n=1 Tax=Eucyclogobius newberryi TaxID=166745 RepID=UPI003B5B9128
QIASSVLLDLVSLCLIVPAVEAYDAGDAIALLLGSVLTGVGLCACLGWYARKRNERL